MEEKTPKDTAKIVGLGFSGMLVFIFGILWLSGTPPWRLPKEVYIVLAGFALLFIIAGIVRYKGKDYIKAHQDFFGYILLGLAVLQFIAYVFASALEDGITLDNLAPSIIGLICFAALGIMLIRKKKKEERNPSGQRRRNSFV
ncbi:hypothetical protein JXA12_04710 [Candidatus Woesearchaeota archaeon]|nr:hypothetical protein [Candidatus Woesearchaeota archaeon]